MEPETHPINEETNQQLETTNKLSYKEKIMTNWKPIFLTKENKYKQRFKELTTKYKITNKQELTQAIQNEINKAKQEIQHFETKTYGQKTKKIWQKILKQEEELQEFIKKDEKIF
ncbi:hypothetical protein K9L97_05255 [Candidatus Woesearchaeota archaeon]|nr:hypothetical protein [Candidatus Woesearchaeota archaeon]